MLSGVGIICFAGSYTVALLLEVSRLLFRSGVRGAIMLGFAGAGLLAHSAYLYYRAIDAVGSPLSSERDWYLLAAWLLAAMYLLLTYYHPRTAFGLFLLPLVLALIAAATFFANSVPFAQERATTIWGIIHGTSILLAAVSVLIGFAAGLMYLWQARRLKHKLPPGRGLLLPSLEWLERTNSRVLTISVLMLGVGVASGMVLNVIRDAAQAERVPWNDLFVLGTQLMFAWLLISKLVGVFYRPARQGRKVAYFTVVSFVFLMLVLAAGLFLETRHWAGERQRPGVRDQGPGARGQGPGFRVQGSGFRMWASQLDVAAFGRASVWRGDYGPQPWFSDKVLADTLPLPWGTFPTCLWVVGTLETCPTTCAHGERVLRRKTLTPNPSPLAPRPWPLLPDSRLVLLRAHGGSA